ncbi:cathepsin F-like [Scyliorhinus canicula]|uniref:cathepsin F-like n=1 Tax=Scyliorhinus canicula TaxID=7830 RepID=UPI0018F7764F|nr:cathepsin F-like [Scyliorhinus canicula]
MFRLALVCLALSYSLVLSEIDPEEDIDLEDETKLRSQFEDFKVKYDKEYDEQDEETRFQIFVQNLKEAKRIQEQDRGTAVYGVTKFSDLSDEEFQTYYLNPVISNNNDTWPEEVLWTEESGRLANLSCPRYWDWRRRGAVTAVINQRRCSAGWAFGVVGNIEALLYLKTKVLRSLSVQELLDCDSWDRGCRGGYPYNAFNAIMKLGGLMSSIRYRYRARRCSRCSFVRTRIITTIRTYQNIRPYEHEMAAWLSQRSPFIVTINGFYLKHYRTGIIRPRVGQCSSYTLNHVALVVAYNTCGGVNYWTLKNSWGTQWGMNVSGSHSYIRTRGPGLSAPRTCSTSSHSHQG